MWGDPIAGYTGLMAVVRFLGGAQLITLGMSGEHLGRLYEESKQRPLNLIDRFACGLAGTEPVAADPTQPKTVRLRAE